MDTLEPRPTIITHNGEDYEVIDCDEYANGDVDLYLRAVPSPKPLPLLPNEILFTLNKWGEIIDKSERDIIVETAETVNALLAYLKERDGNAHHNN